MIEQVKDIAAELTPDFCASIKAQHDPVRPFMPFNREHFIKTWNTVQKAGIGACWKLTEDGVVKGAIGGVAADEMIDGGRVASLAFWFARNGDGSSFNATVLFLKWEMWALLQKPNRIVCAVCYDTLNGAQELFLKTRGYSPYEVRLYKTLKAHGN